MPTTPTRRPPVILLAWLTFGGLLSFTVRAQADPCVEPDSAVYLHEMGDAREAVARSDFQDALEHFQWGRQAFDFAVLDYSIGRAHHNLHHYPEAAAAYRAFLTGFAECDDPNGLRALATTYLEDAETRAATGEMAGATAEGVTVGAQDVATRAMTAFGDGSNDAPSDVPPPDAGLEPGWLVLGGGAALLVAGALYDVANAELIDDRQSASDRGDLVAYRAADDEIASARVVDFVLYGVGAAAVVTGVVLLVVAASSDAPVATPAPAVGLGPRDGGAVVTWETAF